MSTKDYDRNIHFEVDKYRVDKVFGLYPKFVSVGKQSGDCGYSYETHIQDEYEFIYMLEGNVDYYCGDKLDTACEGDMYFIQPGQRHEEHSESDPMSFIYIKFFLFDYKGDKMNNLTENVDSQIFRGVSEIIKSLFFKTFDEMQRTQFGFKQIIETAITELLIYVTRKISHNGDEIKYGSLLSIISAVAEEIELETSKNYTVGGLAKKYAVSESFLAHSFKYVIGKPIMRYINERKIREAEYLLASTSSTVKMIAASLGFCDPFHFTKVFKKQTGLCPTEYRLRLFQSNDNVNKETI
ncbi:MAG: AraC family transcriptional regulator [Clostridiales bacterium]|jgi:AraC-like DNA-binding protein|nr:AraC family transcriptional regulator [Clostridiales bacterium]